MKKLLNVLFAVFLLTSCGDATDIAIKDELEYQADNFIINYPKLWQVVDGDDLKEAPKGSMVVFRTPEDQSGIFTNISIIQEGVKSDINSLKYAKYNIEQGSFHLKDFQKISEEEVEISGEKTIIFNFFGKRSINEKSLEFIQTYLVKNQKAYVITAIYATDVNQAEKDKIKDIFKSFHFK
ncbi:MAG: hypothetical protein N4A36_04605 [Candidatus Gracilibacteria bacterium]|jgi:hypothetical protein|nr:hypothetical protein [Candidatus Gracilibacteria bacterium]